MHHTVAQIPPQLLTAEAEKQYRNKRRSLTALTSSPLSKTLVYRITPQK